MYEVTRPCLARLPGAEWHVFEFSPLFIAGALNALWGLRNCLAAFPSLTMHAADERYVLEVPEEPPPA